MCSSDLGLGSQLRPPARAREVEAATRGRGQTLAADPVPVLFDHAGGRLASRDGYARGAPERSQAGATDTASRNSMPRPFSFTRSMRLVSARDFARTYAEGGRARGEIVVVVACPNGTQGTRLGLSVGRAIWRSAVKRNRVRRVFREAFRLSYPELPQIGRAHV